jgi:phage protein D
MTVRYPKCFARIGEAKIPVINCTVNRTAKRQADTFNADLSVTEAARYGLTLAKIADWDPVDVTILMSLAADGSDEREMITGKVDLPNIAWGTMHFAIKGRDKSASLVESKRNEKFQNQKPKEIAEKIAKAHGLTLKFTGSDSGFAGKTYGQDFAHLALNTTDWEVLASLSASIGCRFYVDGKTLYMEPKDTGKDSFDLIWVPPDEYGPAFANIVNLTTRRDMSAARPIEVDVRSWHHHSKKLFKSKARIDGKGEPLPYRDHHNGKTQDQVEKLAKSRARDIARHELSITWVGPATLDADVRKVCNLSGTGTIYDQGYATEQVNWSYGYGQPFHMVVDATSAKSGRDPEGNEGSPSEKTPNATPEQQGPNKPQNVPLPPQRPAGLGGGVPGGTGPVISA